jgi:glycosyltransferase involved in cell wall biosynthesis
VKIVLRLLWSGGVARIALALAKETGSELIVYRRSDKNFFYNSNEYDLTTLFDGSYNRIFKKFLEIITEFHASNRGKDATVDLDYIIMASKRVSGQIVYMDPYAGITGLIRKILIGENYAVFSHETSFAKKKEKGLRFLLPKIIDLFVLKKAKLVITNSQWNTDILSKYKINSIPVLPGCYPIDQPMEKKGTKIIAVTLWDKRRNPDIYAHISKIICRKITLVGNWPEPLFRYEIEKKYSEYLEITGAVSEEELYNLYAEGVIYIRFGFEERGPGMGGLEALSHGIPVITNDGLGMKEYIKNGYNGYVVSSEEEAACRINEVLNNRDLQQELSKNAYESSKQYSWNNQVKKLKEILNDAFLT